jgi:type II secretion system protein H
MMVRMHTTIQNGFTLIELLLVAIIMTVAAAFAVPNFVKTVAKLELKQAADDMANAIRYGQLRAVMKGKPQRLNIDAQGYWLEEDRSSEGARISARPAFERIKEATGRRRDFPAGIRLTQDGEPIVFSPDGRIASAAMRLCRHEQCLIVSTGEQRGHVAVLDPEAGESHETL